MHLFPTLITLQKKKKKKEGKKTLIDKLFFNEMFHLLEEGGITRVACGCQTHFQLMVPPKATQTAMPVEKVKYNQYVPFC